MQHHIAPIAFLFIAPILSLAWPPQHSLAQEFELQPKDRVVFLGDGLIEQAQYSGWIELMLSTAYPDSQATFRNLGWSGDTPLGDSRFGLSLLQAGREPADEGWKQLQKQIELSEPTVVIFGYGMASRLSGDSADTFSAEFQSLLDFIRGVNPKVRFVFLSPIAQHQDNGSQEQELAYEKALAGLAAKNNSPFVSLREVADQPEQRKDPIHLNDAGYRAVAAYMQAELNIPVSEWQSSPHAETLRQTILRKNEWWFHRSRPANMAYVFGFRKHEQGQNAREIPEFDKLVAEEEQRIAAMVKLGGSAADPTPEPKLDSQYAKFQEQPVPEFTIDDEFEVTLWAQNPDLNKPIHMNFDAQGRLWVASSEAYPMIEVGQSAPDKIIVLEDTNGDGKADESTVFAEGLLIPTGVAPGDGGVYVAQSTDLLFLQDSDGDGKADSKRRVLSGFGTEDTHHNLHTLRWGPDGKLYMNQSVYTRTDAETPHGVVRLKAGGGFRYDTQTMQMEIFFRGLWNSWGHQFDKYGQSFLTDGAGFAGVAYTFPGASFRPAPGTRQQLGLISPGNWPKFASLEVIEGPSFPDSWQGALVTCDFRANRVTRFRLTEQDAGFVTQQEPDLLRSSSATFRPIDVKQGPDGALYIADWSNPIINHGEVDFRDERRDRWHGRIWRVRWKQAPEMDAPRDLSGLDNTSLLDLLTNSDRSIRDRARRQMIEQSITAEEIDTWLASQQAPATQLEALWLYQAVKAPNPTLAKELLAEEDHRIRAATVRVLGDWLHLPSTLALLERAVADAHPRVRLEAISTLKRVESVEATALALKILSQPMDRFLEHGLALAVQAQEAELVHSLQATELRLSDAEVSFVLQHIDAPLASNFLAARLASGPLPKDGSGPWIELIASAGGPAELGKLLRMATGTVTEGQFTEAGTTKALSALIQAQRLRKLSPPRGDRASISQLLQVEQPNIRRQAIELAGLWEVASLSSQVRLVAINAEESPAMRNAAIEALQQLKAPAKDFQAIVMKPENPLPVRQVALSALIRRQPDLAAQALMTLLDEQDSEQVCFDLWRNALASRKDFGKVVNAQADLSQLSESAVLAGLRACQASSGQQPELQATLQQRSMQTVKTMSPEQMLALAKRVAEGDAARGELIYRRQDLACATCHAIGGVGGRVGPDMTSLGASAPVDYLVESLFAPDVKIKEGYHSLTVLTEDDAVITGIALPQSTPELLILRDANGKLIEIPTVDIVTQKQGKSLMPQGVVDRLTEQEQLDLIAFLSQLGKPGRYDASQGGVARDFQVFAGTHRREQQGADKILNGEMPGWSPLQAFVHGGLPRQVLLESTKQPINISLVHIYLKTQVEVTTDKEVTFSAPAGSAMWIDQLPLDSENEGQYKTRLTAGKHEIILRLDAKDLPEQTELRSPHVAFVTSD